MDQIKIGKFIANMRKNNNMTQKQLADMLNISQSYISRIEKKVIKKIRETINI